MPTKLNKSITLEDTLKRKKMSAAGSRKHFRKNTGIHRVNGLNARSFRGGIRL